MSDTKTYVLPDSGGSGGLASVLASACMNRGIDPNAVLAMCNGNGRNGFGFDDIIALIVVAALFGNGNLGFGGNNGGNNTERQMLMDAIQRNGIDISQLASTLNCSIGQVNTAISQVASQVCALGNQVGMSGQQVINSIQQGNMALTQQICNCCCDIKSLIQGQTNTLQNDINFVNRSVERGFADLGYATRDQTCAIEKSIEAQTSRIIDGQRAAEMREIQRDLAIKDAKIAEQAVIINNGQQSAMFAQMIGQAVAPINAALNTLQAGLSEVQCKLPQTVTLPYSNAVAVPSCIAQQYGFGLAGYANGFWN